MGPEVTNIEDAIKCAAPVISQEGIQEIEKFLRKMRINHYKDTTLKTYEKALMDFYSVTGIVSIKKVKMKDIDNYKEYLVTNGLKSGRRRLGYIKTFIKKSGKAAFAFQIENIRQDRDIPDILTQEEIDLLYQAAKNYPTRQYGKELSALYTAIVSTLYYSGIRRFELCNLTLDDIDYRGSTIRVQYGKGGKSAIVPVQRQCINDIKRYLKYRRPVRSNKLFISTLGKPINDDVVTKTIRKLAAIAKIDKRVTAHTLRRSLATHMIENGASQYVVKDQLRHSKLTTTDKYVHLSSKVLQDRYKESVKAAIGDPKKQKKEMTIEKLTEMVLKQQISEDLYLVLRKDLEEKDECQTENTCRVPTVEVTGSNYVVP